LDEIILVWKRFSKFTDARDAFPDVPCVYVQTDNRGAPIRVGETSTGLESRYRGGNGYALDAAMHNSGNLVFVAKVAQGLSRDIEKELIWREKDTLAYNNQDKLNPPFETNAASASR
jgi:hypothetical protein